MAGVAFLLKQAGHDVSGCDLHSSPRTAWLEAKEKSGTMNTVAHALEDGKQIFCVPERSNSNSGCNKLIKEGAKLIENAKDILEDL